MREQQKGMESESEETSGNSGMIYYPTGDILYTRSVYRIMEIWMLLKKYAD